MSGPGPKLEDVTNPLTIPATHRVAFGYLRINLGMVHAVDRHGRPDEEHLVGSYRSGTGLPICDQSLLGAARDEAVRINGTYRRVLTGQVWPKDTPLAGQRRDGVVLIDLDSTA